MRKFKSRTNDGTGHLMGIDGGGIRGWKTNTVNWYWIGQAQQMNFQSKDDEAGKRVAQSKEWDVTRVGKQNAN